VVTHGLNLPLQGSEAARPRIGAGLTQPGVLAKTAGRSIKRMVQPREFCRTGIAGRVRMGDESDGVGIDADPLV
jgi:hypothetical protein